MADARARRRTLARRCMTFIAEHTQPCLSAGELSAVTPETLSIVLESDALRADVGAVKESMRLIMKHHGIE